MKRTIALSLLAVLPLLGGCAKTQTPQPRAPATTAPASAAEVRQLKAQVEGLEKKLNDLDFLRTRVGPLTKAMQKSMNEVAEQIDHKGSADNLQLGSGLVTEMGAMDTFDSPLPFGVDYILNVEWELTKAKKKVRVKIGDLWVSKHDLLAEELGKRPGDTIVLRHLMPDEALQKVICEGYEPSSAVVPPSCQ